MTFISNRIKALGLDQLKFNFLTGELELIDELKPTESSSLRFSDRKKSILKPNENVRSLKHQLETQIKSIIKNNNHINKYAVNQSIPFGNIRSKSFITASMNDLGDHVSYTNRQKELLTEATNHSFKDLELFHIKSTIDEASIKDPLEAWHAKIPIVSNTYNVKILKKPNSMRWLNSRRLGLFLQSELYIEFKLAMLFSQYDIQNAEQSKI